MTRDIYIWPTPDMAARARNAPCTERSTRCLKRWARRFQVCCVSVALGAGSAGAGEAATAPDDGRALLAAANQAEDTVEGLRLARHAVAALERLAPSAERDALLVPATAFVAAVSLFTNRHKGEGLAHALRQRMASQLESIPADHPLHARAAFHLGRYYYWLGRQNGQAEHYAKARDSFTALDEFKDERLVRMYRGEKLAWPTTYDSGTDGAPAWAIKQREALSRVVEVIHYWINERQDETGSLGGGWGDDVEILRFWPVAVLAADDELTRIGMRRLVEGVWHSPAIDRERGFASRLTDVEHAAEPTADSQPMMLFHDYGSPRYVERNLRAMKLMPDLWTDVNPNGHRLFKASWFSATEVDASQGRDVCSPYCVRAVKAGHWLGWYGGYPEITRLFTEWMDPWVAAAESTARGKPKGVLPASLRFSDERFGGSGPTWYDSGLGKLYRFPAALGLMFEQLLTTYALSNDTRYLGPIEAAADLVIEWDARDPKPDAPPGSRAWAAEQMRSAIVPALSKWRVLTGKTHYDAFLRRAGSPYLRYLLTQDRTPLIEACDASIDSTKYNREMVTTEVRWTDRVAVQGTETLLAMYTGHIGHQGYWPLHAVTWEGTDPGFAALVRKADERSLNVLAYWFGRQRREVSLRLWRLRRAGRYRVRVIAGTTTEGERLEQWTVDWKQRGDAAVITLPARRLVTIMVEPIQLESGPPPEGLPDVAIGPDDVKMVRGAGRTRSLEVTVHNLSPFAAGQAKVKLTYLFSGAQSRIVQEVTVQNPIPERRVLLGVRDFAPSTARAILRGPASLGEYELLVSTSTPDRNPQNNRLRLLTNSDLSVRVLP